ncbi:glucuronate isomerase [candidate division KSB1 bacterium]|nr:glucuronate isomerase [candidate division KSB1 bacterium]
MSQQLRLNPDRFFDPDPIVRNIARELYTEVRDLPIVSPHGHVDPKIFAGNKPFPDPTELILIPDHYVLRMLYSQGIPFEKLGVPSIDGTPVETNHRQIWQIFGDHYYLFAGTPTGVWLQHEFVEVFGITEKLTSASAQRIYDQIQEKLQTPEFLPRALFDRFNIEVLTTTDAASDTLEYHQQIRSSGWRGNIIPCFRPDAVVNLLTPGWQNHIQQLSAVSGIEVSSYSKFIQALEKRRAFFKTLGAVSTDQGVENPYTHELSPAEAETIFQRALKGQVSAADAAQFTAHLIMEMARLSIEDGLVMQLHPGSFRNHNQFIFKRFGPDKGCDIPIPTEYPRNLHALLNKYGNDPRLTLIVFTLDETTYARELAPLAGHYLALRLGPPWWFHDSIQGMTRFRQQVTETAGFYNTVGFNDDTRAFASIPARHDLARRIDSNFLAELVARHIIELDEAHRLSHALAYDLVRQAYKLVPKSDG